jgi:multifunctional 2-oxoglutarate metabolism enzyme
MPETATVQITMPEMGESVTEGIVLEWHVAEGDAVSEGDTVVEVSTDKVDAEVPAPMDGVITKLIASVDDEVQVGAPLAEMEAGSGSGEGQTPGPAGPVAAGDPPPPARQVGVPPTTPPPGSGGDEEQDPPARFDVRFRRFSERADRLSGRLRRLGAVSSHGSGSSAAAVRRRGDG